jgi:septum formation topological specificity factor MinE
MASAAYLDTVVAHQRRQRADEALALRRQGLTFAEIGARTGATASTARERVQLGLRVERQNGRRCPMCDGFGYVGADG